MAKAKAPDLQIQPSIFASVAFLKIHDFGRRPVVEQARLRAQLEAVVAVALPELKENARIVLDAADGIALVVLDDPRAVLALAERTLAAGAVGLPLSIGINHGPVKQSGKGKSEGLLGDGIAVAAAIAELAGRAEAAADEGFPPGARGRRARRGGRARRRGHAHRREPARARALPP